MILPEKYRFAVLFGNYFCLFLSRYAFCTLTFTVHSESVDFLIMIFYNSDSEKRGRGELPICRIERCKVHMLSEGDVPSLYADAAVQSSAGNTRCGATTLS